MAVLVILVGTLVLLGWGIDSLVLKSVIPGLVAMNPATASCFIFAGASLLFFKEASKKRLVALGKIAASAVMLVGLLRIVAYFTPWDFRIDQIFFHRKLGANVMAPNTAWNFFLTGIGLLTLDVKNKAALWLNQALMAAALLTSFLAIIGYVYSIQALYNVTSYIPMALNTAVTFALLIGGALCLRSERGLMAVLVSNHAGGDVARWLLPAAFIIPTLLGALNLLGQKHGYYQPAFGTALMAVSNMLVFAILIWWTSSIINQTDKARHSAETNLRQAHDELEIRVQQRTKELKDAQHQLVQQERLRALGEMASGIAHDFNNALSPILGYSELMLDQDSDDPEKRKTYLKTMNTAARDAANIVSRLRLFGRAQNDNVPFASMDINRLIEQVLVLTQPKWKTQAMTEGVEVSIGKDLRPVPPVRGNEQQMREVLTNLIFNAVDALTKTGSIILRTYCSGDKVALEISDTGSGMTEEVRLKCLEPFFTTKGEHGTGLGLSMVYGIIQRHGGTLDIQSEIGTGTTFLIHLPKANVQTKKNIAQEDKKHTRSLKILYVEDEPIVQTVINEYLTRDGHQVDLACNGADALRKYYENKDKFDLVISDRTMPQMGGEQLAFAVKKLVPSQKFILLSGTADFELKENFKNIDAILNKPVALEDLRKVLASLFPV